MKKIKRIAYGNFRGGSGSHELDAVNVFHGPNGSGKTRALQAVEFALSGNVSRALEEKNIDPMDLLTSPIEENPSLHVSAEFDGGEDLLPIPRVILRSLALGMKGGKPTIAKDLSAAPLAGQNYSEVERKVKEVLGSFPVMLDVHKFIRMSAAERGDVVFKLLAPTVNGEKVQAVLTAGRKISVEGLPQFSALLGRVTLAEHLEGKIIATAEVLVELRKAKARFSSATTGTVQAVKADGKATFRPVAEIEAEVKKLLDEIEQVSRQVEESKRIMIARAQNEHAKKVLIEGMGKIDREVVLSKMNEHIEERKQVLEVLHSFEQMNLEASLVEVEEERTRRAEAVAEADKFESVARSRAEAQETVLELLSGERCPTCGQAAQVGREAAQRVMDELLEVLGRASVETTQARQALAVSVERIGILKGQIANRKEKMKDLNEKVSALDGAIAGREDTLHWYEVAKEHLAKLEAEVIEGDTIDVAAAEAIISGAKARHEECQVELKEKSGYDARVALAKSAALEAKVTGELFDAFSAIAEELVAVKREAVQGALAEVSSEVNAILRHFFGEGPECKFRFRTVDARGHEDFDFGWSIEGAGVIGAEKFTSFDSLSTAQQLATIVALLAPLVGRSTASPRVILLDNVEVIHQENREGFLRALVGASRHVDNVLVATSGEFPHIDGVLYHQMPQGGVNR